MTFEWSDCTSSFQCGKIELSFRVNILMLLFSEPLPFTFFQASVLHCIIFRDKTEGNELWLECSTMVTVSLPLKGGEKKGGMG